MKALRFYAAKDLRIEEIQEPSPGPGQVKIRNHYVGICGTDLHEYLHGPIFIPKENESYPYSGATIPHVLGHEFGGVIEKIRDGVTHVKSRQPRFRCTPLVMARPRGIFLGSRDGPPFNTGCGRFVGFKLESRAGIVPGGGWGFKE